MFTVFSFGQVTNVFGLLYSVILQGQFWSSFFGHLHQSSSQIFKLKKLYFSESEDGSEHKNVSSSPPLNLDKENFFDFDMPGNDFVSDAHDSGDFIDDDFGLSIRQESEKLRQQQLLIEQEVRPSPYTTSFYSVASSL